MNSPTSEISLLSSLIRDRAIRAMFQPIVDLDDGRIMGYEALCRPMPDRGFGGADDMFHAAEQADMLWELEEVARSVAMEAAANWPTDVRLFLNSSPRVFADDRFAQALRDDLARVNGLGASQIVLEITERAASQFDQRLVRQVTLAKEAGFSIAVDDAGAGASGLNRMMEIRPHCIKLDRQLVAGIDQDHLKQNLVGSFAHFARMSGVSIIAEGIEKPAELSILLLLGIRFGQGYFLGRPADVASTTDPAAIAAVRGRWASIGPVHSGEGRTIPMARLCTGVPVVESGSVSVSRIAARLMQNPDHSGVIVSEGRCLIGWAERKRIFAHASASPEAPILAVTRAIRAALSAEATLQEALRFACARPDSELAEPIIVSAGPEFVGVVSLRELLRAAASQTKVEVVAPRLAA